MESVLKAVANLVREEASEDVVEGIKASQFDSVMEVGEKSCGVEEVVAIRVRGLDACSWGKGGIEWVGEVVLGVGCAFAGEMCDDAA